MVADTEVGNPGAESADNSRPFVAEYNRSRDVPVTRNNVQIGVAHSRRRDGHFHLAGSRLRELDIGADGHRSGCLKQDRLHRRALIDARRIGWRSAGSRNRAYGPQLSTTAVGSASLNFVAE